MPPLLPISFHCSRGARYPIQVGLDPHVDTTHGEEQRSTDLLRKECGECSLCDNARAGVRWGKEWAGSAWSWEADVQGGTLMLIMVTTTNY